MNEKHQQFINELFKCWNGTDAYLAVYGPVKRTTAAANAARILANPSVADAIRQRLNESAMSADEILMRLAAIARGDIGDFLTVDGVGNVVVDLSKAMAAQKTGLIKRVNQKRTQRASDEGTITETFITIELHDPLTALQLIGKHHKLFTEKTEVTGANGGPIEYKADDAAGDRILSRLNDISRHLQAYNG